MAINWHIDTYHTKDIGLAAYLAVKGYWPEVQGSSFYWDLSEKLGKAIESFRKGGRVPARALMEVHSHLSRRVAEAKPSGIVPAESRAWAKFGIRVRGG